MEGDSFGPDRTKARIMWILIVVLLVACVILW